MLTLIDAGVGLVMCLAVKWLRFERYFLERLGYYQLFMLLILGTKEMTSKNLHITRPNKYSQSEAKEKIKCNGRLPIASLVLIDQLLHA